MRITTNKRLYFDLKAKSVERKTKDRQFQLGDTRSLDNVIREIRRMDSLPSLCTACYRAGRTGKQFTDVEKSSFVHHFCMPNAIPTLKEYLLDYASNETRMAKQFFLQALDRMEQGERDIRV